MNTRANQYPAASAVLWASAMLIMALIIIQAGRTGGNPAFAGNADNRGDYSMLTASSGLGDDAAPDEVLFVIDHRDEVVLVYEIENVQKRQVILRDGGSLANLFRNARR